MAEVASAFVSLLPSAKGFGRSMDRQITPQVNGVAKKSGSRFGKVFASATMSPLRAIGAAAFGLFAIAKVKDFFKGAIAEAREAQKVSALTANVIKTTGGAAGISAKQVGDLAASISNLTGIDDEAIQSGANLLLTFTNLRNEAGKGNDVFNEATSIITDMSVALDSDLKGSAIQVGKALNDPIKGITALTRVGVSFTEQQKEQITAMVESGNTLGAQKLILKELNKEFGGSAEAAATAGDKLKTAFNNMQEAIGAKLLPYLDKAELALAGLFIFLTEGTGPAFGAFKQKIMPVLTALQDLAEIVRGFVVDHLQPFLTVLSGLGGAAVSSFAFLIGNTLVSAILALVGALLSPVALIGALVGAAIYAYFHFDGFRQVVDNLATAFMTKVVPALQQFWGYLTSTVIPAVVAFAQQFAATILPVLQRFGDYLISTVIPKIKELADQVSGNLKPVWDQVVATFTGSVLPVLKNLVSALREHWPEIKKIIETVATLIGKWIEFSTAVGGKVIPIVLKVAGFLIGTLGPALIKAGGFVIDLIAHFIDFGKKVISAVGDAISAVADFVKAVKDKIGDAISIIQDIPGKVKSAIGNLGSLLFSAGASIIQGLIDGVTSKIGALKSKLGEITSLIPDIKGPPKKDAVLLRPAGQLIMKGLVDGLNDGIEPMSKKLEEVGNKLRNGLKSKLEQMKSDFASLRDSIAGAFSVDLFSGSLADFFKAGTKSAAQLTSLIRDIKTLKTLGVGKGFLSAMLNSGNFQFIHQLAGSGIGEIRQAQALFGEVQGLQSQVGAVGAAAASDLPNKIDKLAQQIENMNKRAGDPDKGDHLARSTINGIGRAVANASRGHGNVTAARGV